MGINTMEKTIMDKEIQQLLDTELQYRKEHVEMRLGENSIFPQAIELNGTVLTNKYAEGYPFKRYYGGCEFVDITEQTAIDRACQLFCSSGANVQSHSLPQAYMAILFGVLKPQDCILTLDTNQGGFSMFSTQNSFLQQLYQFAYYKNNESGIDYENLSRVAQQHHPKLIIVGSKNYAGTIDFEKCSIIAKNCGAYLLVDMSVMAGLIINGNIPQPMPTADFVVADCYGALKGPKGAFILFKDEDTKKAVNSKIFPGLQGGPLCHTIASKSITFKINSSAAYKEYIQALIEYAKILGKKLQEKNYTLFSEVALPHVVIADLHTENAVEKLAAYGINASSFWNTAEKTKVIFDVSTLVSQGISQHQVQDIADCIHTALQQSNTSISNSIKSINIGL